MNAYTKVMGIDMGRKRLMEVIPVPNIWNILILISTYTA